jgi:hypothetical protein
LAYAYLHIDACSSVRVHWPTILQNLEMKVGSSGSSAAPDASNDLTIRNFITQPDQRG